jgi:4-amino-4-deoxy-L-arabinose transferase-like glycosyltransferase
MEIPRRTARSVLGLVIAVYVMLGALYATNTPRWQAPDEPAHFNYIAYLATERSFPVLQPGDYPHQYLEEIKAARFPPTMPITALRYESHQPPLYYLLGAPVYLVTSSLSVDSQVLALRLFSVALGAAGLWVLHRMAREALAGPSNDGADNQAAFASLVATAFVAVLPMHIAMTAAINNDVLGELILLIILWHALRTIRRGFDLRHAWAMGLLLGLALLTKTTIYLIVAGVLALSVWLAAPRQREQTAAFQARVRYLGRVWLVGSVVAGPWFARNALVYGDLDLLAWQRHDAVVAGQLRTQDLLAQLGLPQFLARFVQTTFRSFWGQFGWMGVLVDERLYLALAVLSGVVVFGFAQLVLRLGRGEIRLAESQRRAVWLLVVSAALTLLTYLGYNIKFVQHQGRYLFTALGPLAIAVGLSVAELLRPQVAKLAALLLLLAALLGALLGALAGDLPSWTILLLGVAAVWLTLIALLPGRWRWLPLAGLYTGLLVLNPILIRHFIVPALSVASASP